MLDVLILCALRSDDGVSSELELAIHRVHRLLVLLDDVLLVLLTVFARLIVRLDLRE